MECSLSATDIRCDVHTIPLHRAADENYSSLMDYYCSVLTLTKVHRTYHDNKYPFLSIHDTYLVHATRLRVWWLQFVCPKYSLVMREAHFSHLQITYSDLMRQVCQVRLVYLTHDNRQINTTCPFMVRVCSCAVVESYIIAVFTCVQLHHSLFVY